MDAQSRISPRRSRRVVPLAAALAAIATVAAPSTAAAQVNDPPAHISVTASLGLCDGGANNRVCEITVSFDAVADASRYETTISAPDGSSLVQAAGAPGGATYSVPYRGNGTYRVVVTAFGAQSQ